MATRKLSQHLAVPLLKAAVTRLCSRLLRKWLLRLFILQTDGRATSSPLSGQGTVNSFSETAALEMISRDKTRLCFLMFKTGSTVATSGRIFMVYSYGSGPAHLAAISETAMSAAAIPTVLAG